MLEALERVKTGAAAFTTNLFAPPGEAAGWRSAEGDGSLLLFRPERHFRRLYHAAAGLTALDRALGALAPEGVLVSDLVGRPVEVFPVARIYQRHGFREHTSLVRMSKLDGRSPAAAEREPYTVALARETDIPAIAAFLERQLDPYRDRIPTTADIGAAAARGNILLAPGGLLWFETTGLTSTLRYWYVETPHQGIGGRLMQAYLRLARGVRRIVLWVVADNADAIAKYKHYGFRTENLVDRIMIQP